MDQFFSSAILENLSHIVLSVEIENFTIQSSNKGDKEHQLKNVIGRPCTDFILPQYQKRYIECLIEVKEKGTKCILELEGKDSTNEKGFAWYKTHFVPVPNKENIVTHVLCIAENIDLQKKAEQALLTKQNNLEAIINNTDDIIISIDRENRIIEFNEVFRNVVKHGYKVEVKKGDNVLDYIETIKHQKLIALYPKVLRGEKIVDVEKFTSGQGRYIYFETSYNPLRNHNNEIFGITLFSKNITEKIERENSLKQALAEKEILLSEIHHRLKNNLAVISGMMQIQSLSHESSDVKQILSDSILRIKSAAIVHETLYEQKTFSKISIKHYLPQLFNEVKKAYGGERINFNLIGDDCEIDFQMATPFALMMNEIYTNAFKHGFKDKLSGHITTTIFKDKEECKIVILEDGIPFPENFQNNNSTASVGMLLINTFTEQLNGIIEYKNNSPKEVNITFNLGAD